MRYSAFSFLALALLLLTACASRPPHEFDESASFAQYATFAWLPPTHSKEDVSISHPVLDSPLLAGRVKQAVTSKLREKGFQPVEADPDFFVTYHTAQGEREYRGSYLQLGFGRFGPRLGSAIAVDMWPRSFKEGTLIIDIVDGGTGELVWRGWRDTELTRRNFDAARVHRAVDFILSAFPPGRAD